MSDQKPTVDFIDLCPSDWKAYKVTRLHSLQDSPDSFGSTYDREVAFSHEQWVARLSATPNMVSSLALMATANQVGIGLISGVIRVGSPAQANVYQMWVAPDYRGFGVGAKLLEQLIVWASSNGAQNIKLSVTTTNLAAIALYESFGFKDSGSTEPLREGSLLISKEMELRLTVG